MMGMRLRIQSGAFQIGTGFDLIGTDSFMGNLVKNIVYTNSSARHYSKLLDLSALKHKTAASNIANAETPGYKRKTFDFDSELRKSMEEPRLKPVESHQRHIPLSNSGGRPPRVIEVDRSINSTGINSVDIDQEMSDLAQNQLIYQYGSKMIKKKFEGLRDAIKGR